MQKFMMVNQKEEIISLINQAPSSNRGEVWQTLPDVRHHYKILNVRDDIANKAIIIETGKDYEFSTKHPVYVRINHRDLIFKLTARSFILSGNKLACIYPNMAKAIDKRGLERIPLPENRETPLVLKPLGAGAAELAVKLVDISKKGLGVSVSNLNHEYLIRNGIFQIVSVNGIYLSEYHQIELKHIGKWKKGLMKSGFKLKHPFNDTVFDLICKTIFGA